MKIFNIKEEQPRSLYTPKEEALIKYLLSTEWTESDKASRILFKLQQRQVAREVRIIENKPNANDIKNGFTQKEFPWLAKFNY